MCNVKTEGQVRSVPRTRVSIIIKKFKEKQTVQKKPGRGGKGKTSKTLGIKLVRDASEDPRAAANMLVCDSVQWNCLKEETRWNPAQGLTARWPTKKTPFLQKRCLQARLKCAKDDQRKRVHTGSASFGQVIRRALWPCCV